MDSKWMRLLLAATAIGALYLAASVGGAAQAGSDTTANKLSRKTVRKIVNKQISARAPGLSVGHAASAESADQAANAETLAGSPASAFQRTVRWAVVSADQNGASVVRGNATGARLVALGSYGVSFASDIRGCAYIATNGDVGSGFSDSGEISVERSGSSEVEVRHYNSAGDLSDYPSGENEGFHLAVIC